MANAVKGELSLAEVGYPGHTLLLDFNAMCNVEDQTGQDFKAVFDEKNLQLRTIRTVFWAGLKEGGLPEITVEEAGKVVSGILAEHGITKLTSLLMEALRRSGFIKEGGSGASASPPKKGQTARPAGTGNGF